MEINKALYEEILQNVKAILREKPNANIKQLSKRISVITLKNTRIRLTREQIEEYINKYIEDGIIEVKQPLEEENNETAEERRKRFTKQFTVDVKEQNIESQLKKSINQEKDDKKSSGFYTRNR